MHIKGIEAMQLAHRILIYINIFTALDLGLGPKQEWRNNTLSFASDRSTPVWKRGVGKENGHFLVQRLSTEESFKFDPFVCKVGNKEIQVDYLPGQRL